MAWGTGLYKFLIPIPLPEFSQKIKNLEFGSVDVQLKIMTVNKKNTKKVDKKWKGVNSKIEGNGYDGR